MDDLRRVSCPVDVVFPDIGIRARLLPGYVDFGARTSAAPEFSFGEDLSTQVERTLDGDPGDLVPLKIDMTEAPAEHCACGAEMSGAIADLALGPTASFVVEGIACALCPGCRRLRFHDNGTDLRERIGQWASGAQGASYCEPSLRYVSDAHPRNLQIEVSTRCNLACAYCSHKSLETNTDMTAAAFERLMEAVHFDEIDYVDFTGLGEATLNGELREMIRRVARAAPHADIGIVSNALAASVDRWEGLIKAGLTSVSFSIDTLDPERFARQRGGGSLAKAMRIVKGVAKIRARLGRRLALRLKAVLLDDSHAVARALQDWSLQIGLDRPQFSALDARDSAASLYGGAEHLTAAFDSDAEAEAFDREMDRRWTELGGSGPDPRPPRRYRHPGLALDKEICHWALNAAFVTAEGELLRCCESMIDLPRRIEGSLRDMRMTDAWHQDLFWSYRLPLSLGLLPEGCAGCSYAPSPARPM